jgi:hypothetical protein
MVALMLDDFSWLVSTREAAVEVAMCSDPEPKPFVATAQRDGADVSRHTDGPSAWLEMQSFEA